MRSGYGANPSRTRFLMEETMVLIQSLLLAGCLLWFAHDFIKKHAAACYGAACLISLIVIVAVWAGILPNTPWILPIFTQGGLGGALFIAVMFAAAVPNGSRYMRLVMPIRGELSIIASILTLGHNIAFGRTYFVRLFAGTALPFPVLCAAICSLCMIVIMLPLFITSFRCVRRRMKPKSWKWLQRFAYAFYALMYVHVLLLNLPGAHSSAASAVNVILYSIVFLSYGCMRVRKAMLKKKYMLPARILPAIGALLMIGICVSIAIPRSAPSASAAQYADGTYTGAGIGYNGRITVQVTVEDHRISDIILKSSVDDEPYITDAVRGVIPAVLETQSVQVDAISGATYASNGIKDAIADALQKAE